MLSFYPSRSVISASALEVDVNVPDLGRLETLTPKTEGLRGCQWGELKPLKIARFG
jgi:hypothetical protein